MRHLPARVDAGIRAAGAHDFCVHLEQVAEDAFEFALHRAQVTLSRPPSESGAVVGDVEAQTNQPVTRESGDGLIDG